METIFNENKIVHGLWIGEKLSPLELLCIRSFLNAGHQFYLWTYQPIHNLPSETKQMDANFILPHNKVFSYSNFNKYGHGKGSYAGFSDIFRYKLLYEYGGWWTDMDITCLKSLNFHDPYVFRLNGQKGIVGNLMKCPQYSPLMNYCYERSIKEMNAQNTEWLLPVNILNEGIKKFDLHRYEKEFTNEDSWPLVSSYLLSFHTIPGEWYAIHWMNEEWRRFNINKDYYIPTTTMEKILVSSKINHQLLTKLDALKLKLKLGKWNYRLVNLNARIRWYYNLLKTKLRTSLSRKI